MSPWLSGSRVSRFCFFARSFSVSNIAEKSLTWLTSQYTHTHALSHVCIYIYIQILYVFMFIYIYICICVCMWTLIPFISYSLLVQSCCFFINTTDSNKVHIFSVLIWLFILLSPVSVRAFQRQTKARCLADLPKWRQAIRQTVGKEERSNVCV